MDTGDVIPSTVVEPREVRDAVGAQRRQSGRIGFVALAEDSICYLSPDLHGVEEIDENVFRDLNRRRQRRLPVPDVREQLEAMITGYLRAEVGLTDFRAWEAEFSLDAAIAGGLRTQLDRLALLAEEVEDGVRNESDFSAAARSTLNELADWQEQLETSGSVAPPSLGDDAFTVLPGEAVRQRSAPGVVRTRPVVASV